MLANTMPLRTEVLLGNAICVIAICTTVFVWLELLFVSLHIESLSAREFGFMKRQWEDGTDDDWGDWSKFGKKQEPAPFLRQAELDRRRQQQQEATAATRGDSSNKSWATTWWDNNMVGQAQHVQQHGGASTGCMQVNRGRPRPPSEPPPGYMSTISKASMAQKTDHEVTQVAAATKERRCSRQQQEQAAADQQQLDHHRRQ